MSALENNPKKQDQSERNNLNAGNFAANPETGGPQSNEGGNNGEVDPGDLKGASYGSESASVRRSYMEAQCTTENHQKIEDKMSVGNSPEPNQSKQQSGEQG